MRSLKQRFDIPVIAAGGITDGWTMASMLALGAAGVSVGTPFIATNESPVSMEYKHAIVDAKMDDIVMSNKISGSWATIINTPYARKIGYTQNRMERYLSNHKLTKKYFKMWVQIAGMKKLSSSIQPGNYKTLWIAGKSSDSINEITKVSSIIEKYKIEFKYALTELFRNFPAQKS